MRNLCSYRSDKESPPRLSILHCPDILSWPSVLWSQHLRRSDRLSIFAVIYRLPSHWPILQSLSSPGISIFKLLILWRKILSLILTAAHTVFENALSSHLLKTGRRYISGKAGSILSDIYIRCFWLFVKCFSTGLMLAFRLAHPRIYATPHLTSMNGIFRSYIPFTSEDFSLITTTQDRGSMLVLSWRHHQGSVPPTFHQFPSKNWMPWLARATPEAPLHSPLTRPR